MEKDETISTEPAPYSAVEKPVMNSTVTGDDVQITDGTIAAELNATQADLDDARALAEQMSLNDVRRLMEDVYRVHENDPNFPHQALRKIKNFIRNENIFDQPEKHADLIYEMKIEAALITNDSPYAEVRAVVSNRDDPSLPSSTVRVWVIGLGFSVIISFVNQLFSIRQPAISVTSNVAQLLAYPIGKAWEKSMPDWGFMLPAFIVGSKAAGTPAARLSLNPGPFNRKEHMLITIMAGVSYNTPYTDYIVWTQHLKQYFNQSYAGQFSYQILVALSTSLIGYGLAGLTRRFLVYPAYCVWPTSLVTIAFNEAFHNEEKGPVSTPWKSVWNASRMKFFLFAFTGMFFYNFFPNYIFQGLSVFSWMTWIAPQNVNLSAITGFNNGVGINPVPTFDWNNIIFNFDPLVVPFFSTINFFFGAVICTLFTIALWYTNALNTGYLPINSNHVYNNKGTRYNITEIVDHRKFFNEEMYQAYSPGYLSAGSLTMYTFYFAIYPATLIYVYLNHSHEVTAGMTNTWRYIKNSTSRLFSKSARDNQERNDETGSAANAYRDVHNRLMAAYPEVPELWYLLVLVGSIALGIAGLVNWQTYTTPGVIFYGILLCLVFVIPIGIISAITGLQVTLNVLAEFIGGAFSGGNALAMNYFKAYGYLTCASAVSFSNDLKLAHYVKIPPRHTFAAQLIATVVSCFVCTGVLNFQMNKIANVCTPEASDKMYCPGITTFFTASVMWGTIGPARVFGKGGQYTLFLLGFPIGIIVPIIFWYIHKKAREQDVAQTVDANGNIVDDEVAGSQAKFLRWARQIHPIAALYGAISLTPYSISYIWPMVPVGFASWMIVRARHLAFWSRYNYVLSASFSSAVALSGVIAFFALDYSDINLNWWGNNIVGVGCEYEACPRLTLAEGDHFGPGQGQYH